MTLRELIWQESPARARLLAMCGDYQEREAEWRASPARAPGESLCNELAAIMNRSASRIPRDNLRLLLGKGPMATLMNYKNALDARRREVGASGAMLFRGVRCLGVDSEDGVELVHVLPNRWVRIG